MQGDNRPKMNSFLSTPSARRATFCGSDFVGEHSNFYPRPPRGGRLSRVVPVCSGVLFLSTPSARRATRLRGFFRSPAWDFYPRPPRGGRQLSSALLVTSALFLSTPSARRATIPDGHPLRQQQISIHALREEGDRQRGPCCRHRPISIHALREEGDECHNKLLPGLHNISIHALREEGDLVGRRCCVVSAISIHALREEGDGLPRGPAVWGTYFYPRPPRGGRRRPPHS